MNTPAHGSGKLNSIRLMKLLIKWRKQLIITSVGSVIVAIIITMPQFMTPMFKSTAVIYPSNLRSYSKESPTEQMVQYLHSEDVLMQLASAFSLYKHYEIDSNGQFPRFEMLKRINENVKVAKTEFESIEINVWDKAPLTASQMCDSLIRFADLKARSIHRDSCQEALIVIERQLTKKKNELDSMENAIKVIRMQYGITDFENQVEGFSREYYHSLSAGAVNEGMRTAQQNLQEKGGEYILLKELLWRARGDYFDTKLRYDYTLSEIRKERSYHSMVSRATPAERKDYPKRTLIILLFTLSVLFVAILIVVYKEHYRKLFNDEILSSGEQG
jgi:hypothetical protein